MCASPNTEIVHLCNRCKQSDRLDWRLITYPTRSRNRFFCSCISWMAYNSLRVKSMAIPVPAGELSPPEEAFLPRFWFCTELAWRYSRNIHLSLFRPWPGGKRISENNNFCRFDFHVINFSELLHYLCYYHWTTLSIDLCHHPSILIMFLISNNNNEC